MAPIKINEEDKKAANLRVLQKADPSITEIIAVASHAVLYEFDAVSNAWEKRNVEGSLFVAKRSIQAGTHPGSTAFSIIIMNRNSKNNLDVSLTPNFQMQIKEPYLIFRSNRGSQESARAIWFHDSDERTNICQVLQKIMQFLSSADLSSPTASSTSIPQKESPTTTIMNKEEATASLMAVLRIGGTNTTSHSSETQKVGDKTQPSPTPLEAQELQKTFEKDHIVLDKKTLQLTLLSLIQDERFIDLIHAKYLTIANARTGKKS